LLPIQRYSPAEKRRQQVQPWGGLYSPTAVGKAEDGPWQSVWIRRRLSVQGQDAATAGSPPDGFVSYRGGKSQCTRGV
jgi:hypothetical protein